MTEMQSSIDELIKEKDYTRALAMIEIEPDTPDNLFKKARILIGLDKLDEAIVILKRIDGSYRQDTLAGTLAEVYYAQKKYDEARYWANIASKYPATAEAAKRLLSVIQVILPEQFDTKEEKILQVKPIKPTINFNDIVGLEKAKKYMQQNVIGAIKDRKMYEAIGKRITAGCILYGPPGVGKTMLAKALAGETGAWFISCNMNEIIGSYVGVSAKNLSSVFLQARMHSPCILFFDEIDALAVKRGGNTENAHGNVNAQVVNQFLTELDGIDKSSEGLFLIAATNRPYAIDSAFKRGKRLGDAIYLPLPNESERSNLISYYLEKLKTKIKINVDINRIARATEMYSPADIDAVIDKSLNGLLNRNDKTLRTADLLIIIKQYKSSSLAWFTATRAELEGRPIYQYNEGKREIIGYEGGLLSPAERYEYEPLIEQIKQFTNPKTQKINYIKTIVAKYIM